MNRREQTQKFIYLQEKFPNLGDTIIFAKLIEGKKFTREQIEKMFYYLVKEKYPLRTRREYFDWCETI